MKTRMLVVTGLLISTIAAAQKGETTMEQHADQLPQQGRGSARVAYLGRSIDQMIYEFMEEQQIPGMTLAIVQAPYIPRVVGYGVTDLANGNLAAVKTLWPIGPISQGYTAVAMMQLYERGALKLSDPVGKYLKELPLSWRNITLMELLQHSSGIADYAHQSGFDVSRTYTPRQLIALVAAEPLAFTPGSDVRQSATNFLLLSSVIEAVSGMSYEQFVRKNQLDYLGLKQTFFGSELEKVPQDRVAPGAVHQLFKKDKEYIAPTETATGYVEKQGILEPAPVIAPFALKGYSDLWASAENVSFWDIALAGSVLIAKPENRALIYEPTTLSNGKVVPAMAGWQFYHHKGLMDIKGSVSGFSSFLSRFTDASELVCVTLLANKQGVDLTNLARRIAAAFDAEKMGTGADDNQLYTFESQFSVSETMARLEQNIRVADIPIFARYDHQKNAEEVGLELRPTQVIVFGSPKVGTLLMQQNQSIAIDLPLRISVWEDASGSVWVNFPQMKELALRYGLSDHPAVAKIQSLLEALTVRSASIY